MSNKNDDILKNAINNLPDYTAPEYVWSGIEESFALKKAILELPEYNANPKIWNNIEKSLESEKRLYLYSSIIKLMKYAATITVIALISIFYFNNNNNNNNSSNSNIKKICKTTPSIKKTGQKKDVVNEIVTTQTQSNYKEAAHPKNQNKKKKKLEIENTNYENTSTELITKKNQSQELVQLKIKNDVDENETTIIKPVRILIKIHDKAEPDLLANNNKQTTIKVKILSNKKHISKSKNDGLLLAKIDL